MPLVALAEDEVAHVRSCEPTYTRGRDRRGAERLRRSEARARGGFEVTVLRTTSAGSGTPRERRAASGRDAHEHEPRMTRVLGLPRPRRPPAHPRATQVHAYPYAPQYAAAVRRAGDPALRHCDRAGGPWTASRSTPSSSPPVASAGRAPPKGWTFTGEFIPVRLPRRRIPATAPRSSSAGDQRARDRVRPRTGRADRRPPSPQRYVIQKIVDGVPRTGGGSRSTARSSGVARPGRARPLAPRSGSCVAGARRPTSARPRRTRHPRRRHRALPGLPRPGRRRPHHLSSGDRRDRRAHCHVRRDARELTRSSARRGTTSTFPTSTPSPCAGCSGPSSSLAHRTLHPDLPGLGSSGSTLPRGPYRSSSCRRAGSAGGRATSRRPTAADAARDAEPRRRSRCTTRSRRRSRKGRRRPAGRGPSSAAPSAPDAPTAIPPGRTRGARRGRGGLRRAARRIPPPTRRAGAHRGASARIGPAWAPTCSGLREA